MAMMGIQIFNLLLVLSILAVITVGVVMLLKVLFKLNKALDIWLAEKQERGGDS